MTFIPSVSRNSGSSENPNRAAKINLKTREMNSKSSQKEDASGECLAAGDGMPRCSVWRLILVALCGLSDATAFRDQTFVKKKSRISLPNIQV